MFFLCFLHITLTILKIQNETVYIILRYIFSIFIFTLVILNYYDKYLNIDNIPTVKIMIC